MFDTSLEYDSELFEDTVGLKLQNFDRQVFGSAYEVDVGSGADWPVVVYEVLETIIPFSSIAAALFFGEKIEKSAMAWKRMAAHLLSLIPDKGFTDANGAALLPAHHYAFYNRLTTVIELLCHLLLPPGAQSTCQSP